MISEYRYTRPSATAEGGTAYSNPRTTFRMHNNAKIDGILEKGSVKVQAKFKTFEISTQIESRSPVWERIRALLYRRAQ